MDESVNSLDDGCISETLGKFCLLLNAFLRLANQVDITSSLRRGGASGFSDFFWGEQLQL